MLTLHTKSCLQSLCCGITNTIEILACNLVEMLHQHVRDFRPMVKALETSVVGGAQLLKFALKLLATRLGSIRYLCIQRV